MLEEKTIVTERAIRHEKTMPCKRAIYIEKPHGGKRPRLRDPAKTRAI